ncbi:MAG: hypothetical protein M3Y55_03195 [Pseudomonadota bacterium]|nr:hypothetical protein [Pseudomonadota bacterium]
MSPQARIVVVAAANGLCGAALAVASALHVVSVGVAIVIALCVMAATWILLRRAILDQKRSSDTETSLRRDS